MPFSAPYLSCMYYPSNTNKEEDVDKVVDSILEKQQLSTEDKSEIDSYFYKLYGLTYDEVLIVDPETPITREKYEDKNNL